jgi:hypothetical protein
MGADPMQLDATFKVPDLPTELQQLYPMTCCACSKEMRVEPSMMMTTFGMNTGAGQCLQCKLSLHLHIDGDRIVSIPMDDFIAWFKEYGHPEDKPDYSFEV